MIAPSEEAVLATVPVICSENLGFDYVLHASWLTRRHTRVDHFTRLWVKRTSGTLHRLSLLLREIPLAPFLRCLLHSGQRRAL